MNQNLRVKLKMGGGNMLRFSPAPPTERGQYAPDIYTAFSTLGGQHLPDCHEKLTGKSEKYSVNFTG
jgi:hypothetical protein